jgi:hypothetical protein
MTNRPTYIETERVFRLLARVQPAAERVEPQAVPVSGATSAAAKAKSEAQAVGGKSKAVTAADRGSNQTESNASTTGAAAAAAAAEPSLIASVPVASDTQLRVVSDLVATIQKQGGSKVADLLKDFALRCAEDGAFALVASPRAYMDALSGTVGAGTGEVGVVGGAGGGSEGGTPVAATHPETPETQAAPHDPRPAAN